MQRYLVIFFFILSFLANSNGMLGMLSANNTANLLQQVDAQHASLMQESTSLEPCHQSVASKTSGLSDCQMGEACGDCFTHCGGALLMAEFPGFVAKPSFLVSILAQYYTPLVPSSFFKPPQIS